MQLLNNTLYLEYNEMQAAGVSTRTMEDWAAPVAIKDPADKRVSLFAYELLKEKYQQQVKDLYGCPYQYQSTAVFKQHLTEDKALLDFFRDYRSASGKFLPRNKDAASDMPTQLAKAAAWLNLFVAITDKALPLGKEQYAALRKDSYHSFRLALKAEGVKYLSKSYNKLMVDKRCYQQQGLAYLVPANLENSNAKKLVGDVAALLNTIAAQPMALDAGAVALRVNTFTVQAGLQKAGKPLTVTRRTALKYINDNRVQIDATRLSPKAWGSKYMPMVERERPSFPLSFVCHDGWDCELYYQKEVDGKPNYWQRKMVLLVMDAYNDYPLGYTIYDAGRESAELVREAYLNALHHIKQLTGAYHLPWQLKSDNFAFKSLEPLYNKLAASPDFVCPIKVGNSKDNPIESFFNRFNTTYCQPQYNWSGRGFDARKENQPNRDALTRNRHDFPTEQGVIVQLMDLIEQVRKGKQQAWLQGWKATNQEAKREISRHRLLEDFGIQRRREVKLNNRGLHTQIANNKYSFMLVEQDFYSYYNSAFTINYDPYDMRDLLATCYEQRVQYLVPHINKAQMAFKDQREGMREQLNRILDFGKELGQRMLDANAEQRSLSLSMLEQVDAETVLKIMPTVNGQQKHILKRAEQLMKEGYQEPEREALPVKKTGTGGEWNYLDEV